MAEANADHPEDMRIVFRIGLHLGDLIVDGDDLYGDGVNVAALVGSGLPLVVSCHRCQHRKLLTAKQIGGHEGDYRAIHRLPLLCRCGSKDVDKYVLETPDEARDFLEPS